MNIKENDKVYYSLFLINKILESNYTDEHKIIVISMFNEYCYDEVNDYMNNILDQGNIVGKLANDFDVFVTRVRKEREENSN